MTTELSKLLSSYLTTIKNVIQYCEKVCKRSGKNLVWSIKNYCEVFIQLKARVSNSTSLSIYDCSTLSNTFPDNLIKDIFIDLIERAVHSKGAPYLTCNDRNTFFNFRTAKTIACMVL